MKEEFLHFLWHYLRFDLAGLRTTEGEDLQILHPGTPNTDAGPDFVHARLRIGPTEWAGHVEMHLKASDWLKHGHSSDPAYDNVILHVVFEEDEPVLNRAGQRIPCLCLRSRIPPKLSQTYQKLVHNQQWIPCQHAIHQVDEHRRKLWLDRLMVERLEHKTRAMAERLERNGGDMEETFYQLLASSLGGRVNAEPLARLAEIAPLKLLQRHRTDPLQLEAILFGQAGLLEEAGEEEDYPMRLRREYAYLQHKYGLHPMHPPEWKFMRMRPANFPTVRIAQLATLLRQSDHLLSKALAVRQAREVEHMLEVKVSSYWQTHYRFGKPSIKRNKRLGRGTIHLVIINTLVPFLFLYGRRMGDGAFEERALALVQQLPAEDNAVIRRWSSLGLRPDSAFQSQALLQLYSHYCKPKRCLSCAIGHAILNPSFEGSGR